MKSQPQTPIRAMIVDDERHARENLAFLLGEYCPEIKVVATAENVDMAYDKFMAFKPQLLFLDIRMPSGSEGFDLLKLLEGEAFYVVFVTAFKEYAIRAFENRALHYILKPIDANDLRETVARIVGIGGMPADADRDDDYRSALRSLVREVDRNRNPDKITVKHSKGIKIIDLNDVDCLESRGNCTLLRFKSGGEYLDTRTLKVYESLLPDRFFRLHRSFIVNLEEVSELFHGDSQEAVLRSGRRMPIARERKREFIEKLEAMTGSD